MSPVEFFKCYYGHTEVSEGAVKSVLHILRAQLGMKNPRPEDDVSEIYDDIDIDEICREIAEELQIKYSEQRNPANGGTVNDFIHWVNQEMREIV